MVAHAVGCGNSVYNQKVDVADEVGSGVSPARRFSARLRERSSVSKVSELSSEEEQVDHHHQKKYRTYRRREGKAPIVVAEMPVDEHVTETPPDDKEEILDGTGLMNQALHVVPEQVVAGEGNSACESERSDYAKVKETIRTFNKFFLHFVQEEEKRCRKVEIDERRAKASKPKGQRAAKAVKPKIGGAPEMDTKRASKRPDLKAITKGAAGYVEGL